MYLLRTCKLYTNKEFEDVTCLGHQWKHEKGDEGYYGLMRNLYNFPQM